MDHENIRASSGNIKSMNRQTLIKIVSNSWKKIQTEISLKGFRLTATYIALYPLLMRQQLQLKQQLDKIRNSILTLK